MSEGVERIMDYDELVERIVSTTARSDLREEVPSWIGRAEIEIFREVRPRPSEQIATGTTTGGETSIALPYGAIEPRFIEFTYGWGRRVPETVPAHRLAESLEETDGIVRVVAIFGDAIQLAPAPSAGIPYRLFYFGMPAPLSRRNKTTRLFEMGWDAYYYGALFHGAPELQDDSRIQTWGSYFQRALDSLKRAVWRAEAGAGPLRMRPPMQVDDRHGETPRV